MENKKYEMESKKYFDLLEDLKNKLYSICEEHAMNQHYYSLFYKRGEKSLANSLKNNFKKEQGQIDILEEILEKQNVDTVKIEVNARYSAFVKFTLNTKDKDLEQ